MQMTGEESFLFVALLSGLAEAVVLIRVHWLAHLEVRVLSLHFEVVLQLLFDAFRRLKAVDQLQLLLLHSHNLLFVHHLLVLFSLKLLFNLGLDPILPLKLVHVTLLSSLLLLSADHQLHLLGPILLSGPLLFDAALDSLLLKLSLVSLPTRIVDRLNFLALGPLLLFLLKVVVGLSLSLLFSFILLALKLLLLVHFVVTLALRDDLVCPLACFFDFLNRLKVVSYGSYLLCLLQT